MATTGKSAGPGEFPAAEAGAGVESRPKTPAPATGPQDERPELSAAELADRWRRALADADNLRKRHAVELRRAREEERARVAAAFLPVIDNLELALTHVESVPVAVVQGVTAIRDQAVQLLAALGYPRDDASGIPFDPARHEVVAVVDEPEVEPNMVTQVVRPGYGTDGRALRPTAVAVNRTRE